MLFDDWFDIARAVAAGGLSYISLVAMVRVAGKRTLAKLNAFDLVVTIALGSTLATIALSADVALVEGVAAFAVLALLQLLVARASTRWPGARRLVKAEPEVVLKDGALVDGALRSERLTAGEVRQAVRSSGAGALEQIAVVVLETDGSLSVIRSSSFGSGSALEGVVDRTQR